MPAFSKPIVESNPSHKYTNNPFIKGSLVIFKAKLPYTLCMEWYDNISEKKGEYLCYLGSFLSDMYKLTLNPKETRLAENLRREFPKIAKTIRKRRGKSRQLFEQKCYTINVCQSDLVSATEVGEQLSISNHELEMANCHIDNLETELSSTRDQIVDLEAELRNLHAEIMKAKFERDLLEDSLKDEKLNNNLLMETNEQLQKYVENLCDISVNTTPNTKKSSDFANVSRRYQLKLLKEIRSRGECALWFIESFGLKLESLTFVDSSSVQHGVNYSTLSTTDQEKLKQVLYILDHFYVSDACYSELSVVSDGLPKTYLIKQLRSDMNTMCHIQRTPGSVEGAEINVEDEVIFAAKSYLARHPNIDRSQEVTFSVKFCGDGTNVSRNAGMVVMSFSIFSPQNANLECHQHHCVAVVKAQESYDLYQNSFTNIWSSINSLSERGTIDIDGEEFSLKVFLAADYKFLLMVLGMSGATSNHACIYCTVHKNDRFDMSKDETLYNVPPLSRTNEDLVKCALAHSHSCVHKPLVNLPLQNVIIDELHLMLRITDRLLENLIQEVKDFDNLEKLKSGLKAAVGDNSHVHKLVLAIRECGVSFKVWETRDKSGKGTGSLEFSSLMGAGKKHC